MNKTFLILSCLALLSQPVMGERTRTSEIPAEAQAAIDKWMEGVRKENERIEKARQAGEMPVAPPVIEETPFEVQPLRPLDEGEAKTARNEEQTYRWPSSAVAPVTAEVLNFIFDGYPISRLFFSDGGWLWAMPTLPDFTIRQDPSPYSTRLQNSLFPNVEIQFSFFAEGSFLPDILPPSIEGYLKGLRQEHGKAIKLPTEALAANTRVPINGSFWWNIPYTLVDPEGQRPDVAVVDYIFSIEPYIIIVRHRGPANNVRAGTQMLQNALERSYTATERPTDLLE